MGYCEICGSKLIQKESKSDGLVPYCEKCGEYRFPLYSCAVIMVILNPDRDKLLLIQQYNRPRNILVAGYINKGESAENAVCREISEEIGIKISSCRYNRSTYFGKTNTLMMNFVCVAETEDLTAVTDEVDKADWFTFEKAREEIAQNSLASEFLDDFLKAL